MFRKVLIVTDRNGVEEFRRNVDAEHEFEVNELFQKLKVELSSPSRYLFAKQSEAEKISTTQEGN